MCDLLRLCVPDIEAGINKRYGAHLPILVTGLTCGDRNSTLIKITNIVICQNKTSFPVGDKRSWPFLKFFFRVVKNCVTSPCKNDVITVISRNETKNMLVLYCPTLFWCSTIFNRDYVWSSHILVVNNSRNKELGKRSENPDLVRFKCTEEYIQF